MYNRHSIHVLKPLPPHNILSKHPKQKSSKVKSPGWAVDLSYKDHHGSSKTRAEKMRRSADDDEDNHHNRHKHDHHDNKGDDVRRDEKVMFSFVKFERWIKPQKEIVRRAFIALDGEVENGVKSIKPQFISNNLFKRS